MEFVGEHKWISDSGGGMVQLGGCEWSAHRDQRLDGLGILSLGKTTPFRIRMERILLLDRRQHHHRPPHCSLQLALLHVRPSSPFRPLLLRVLVQC